MSLPEFKFALKMQEPLPVLESFERIGALLAPLNITNFYIIPLYYRYYRILVLRRTCSTGSVYPVTR